MIQLMRANPGYISFLERLGERWKYGRMGGFYDEDLTEAGWGPGRWNSACLTLTNSRGLYGLRLNINGEVVWEAWGTKLNTTSNFVLMNTREPETEDDYCSVNHCPLHGAVTDLNLWDRGLTDQQISDWMSCQAEAEAGGNIVSWETAELNIRELSLGHVERTETCLSRTNKNYLVFNERREFGEIVKFCQNIGGQMAVVTEEQSYHQILQSGVSPGDFFSGYTDRELEGRWVSVITGSPPPPWLPWRPGPEVGPEYDYDCAIVWEGYAEECLCYEKKSTVCEMRNSPSQLLHLTGLCREHSPPLHLGDLPLVHMLSSEYSTLHY